MLIKLLGGPRDQAVVECPVNERGEPLEVFRTYVKEPLNVVHPIDPYKHIEILTYARIGRTALYQWWP